MTDCYLQPCDTTNIALNTLFHTCENIRETKARELWSPNIGKSTNKNTTRFRSVSGRSYEPEVFFYVCMCLFYVSSQRERLPGHDNAPFKIL